MKLAALVTCAFLLPAAADAATCDTLAASLKLPNARVLAGGTAIPQR